MTRFLCLLGALLLAAPAFGQNQSYAFLSTNANEPAKGEPQKKLSSLLLRANCELPFYAYVRNPGADAQKDLIVVLAEDVDGKKVLAEGRVESLAPDATARVTLAKIASAPEKTPPADKAAPPADKAAPPAAPPAAALPDLVYLILYKKTDDNPRAKIGEAKPITVRQSAPREYLDVKPVITRDKADGACVLTVTVGDKTPADPFRGPPCKVVLNLASDLLPGLDVTRPRDGNYEAIVAPGAKDITLVAKGLKFTGDESGFFTVSADGVTNTFYFSANFKSGSEGFATPAPLEKEGRLRINAPNFAETGKPVTVWLEILGDDLSGEDASNRARPRLEFYRSEGGSPERVTGNLTSTRDRFNGLRIGGDGELIAISTIKDWQVKLDTGGIHGVRWLKFNVDGGPVKFKETQRTIAIDDSRPAIIEVKVPPKVVKGGKFTVSARGDGGLLGVRPDKGVLFYIGEPPAEGKEPAKGKAAWADKSNPDGSYSVSLDVPEKGPVDLTVRFTNNAGLSAERTVEVQLVDAPVTGTIEGRVVQGSDRGQPGLMVEVRDADGKVVASGKSDEKGNFKFEGLKPGGYSVVSIKPIDYNSKGEDKVNVVAGQTAKATVSLKR